MSHPLERLAQLGLALPPPPPPGGNYLPFRRVGSLLYLPGAISSRNGELLFRGQVGTELTLEQGYEAARLCALNLLAGVHAATGSLAAVRQVVSVNGYVNCAPGFPDSPKVINGASDLLVGLYGDAGRHVRAAVGVAGLPQNAAVEVQMLVELHP
ncbi:MAG: RidA family protein [Verrucomicrobiota bacterium]